MGNPLEGRLGQEPTMEPPRTRQCDSAEESEELVAPEEVVVFPNVSQRAEALAQYLQLKHRTKLKSPGEFVSNVLYERKNQNQSQNQNQNQQRNNGGRQLRPVKLAWAAMASLLLFSVLQVAPGSHGNEIRPSQARPLKKGEVCGSVDVRNSPSNLERLKGCVVVEGFVHILLIDKYTEASFENYTFPLLTEITEYLLLFRVNGLRTLQKLFPNLTVIRGKKLVTNYAIVIYELMHIEEVGLSSLMYIPRGGVRIEKNPKLCFAKTINWDAIAPGSEIIISDNQKDDVCPICPAETGQLMLNGTRKQCPNWTGQKSTALAVAPRACWNNKHCQNECPKECPRYSCNADGQCCDESCLGGCEPNNPTMCRVCRHYSIDPAGNRRCLTKCPAEMYDHHFRCLTAKQCYELKRPISEESTENRPLHPFIPFNGSCIIDCPVYYEVDTVNGQRKCKKCQKGGCLKKCRGASIDSKQQLQALKDCEIVEGSLTIQLRSRGGENIVKELEQYLSTITEITGFLKVVRSYPLLSLGFFKNLRKIGGKESKVSNASLYVVENQNLQELFEKDVEIGEGKLFFYNNPMLCVSKIMKLREKNPTIGIENEAQLGSSNGDRAACDVQNLTITVRSVSSTSVLLQWAPFKLVDPRQLLGYVVYYIEAPNTNVTLFDGRDACNSEGWKLDDISDSDPLDTVNKLLTQLKPYTQYAYYVKTYTLASEGVGGQSQIQYFTTAPSTPNSVRDVKVDVDRKTNTLILTWRAPLLMHGKLRDYEVFVELNADRQENVQSRDYCSTEMLVRTPIADTDPTPAPSSTQSSSSSGTCSIDQCSKFCSSGVPKESFDRSEKELQINFEDNLHNYVYIKNPTVVREQSNRRKRSPLGGGMAGNSTILFPKESLPMEPKVEQTDRKTMRAPNETFYQTMFNTTNVTRIVFPLENFNHYAQYSFRVRACREKGVAPTNIVRLLDTEPVCGVEAIKNFRTPPLDGADDIPVESLAVDAKNTNGSTVVRVQWAEPKKPNGPILSYTIQYQRKDVELKAAQKCVSYSEFNRSGLAYLTGLEPGNYSVQVMVTTMAGNGPYSAPRFVHIAKDDGPSSAVLVIIVVVLSSVFFLSAGVLWLWYQKKYLPMQNMRIIAQVNPDYAGVVYRIDEWEVEREHIIQLEELGQGSFGMVYRGILTQLRGVKQNIPCAIKTVNESATSKERDSFLMEASVMKQFNTNHVVRLLGVVSQGDPTLVIMELMANGDLKGYLRRHRPDYENGDEPSPQPPTLRQIYQMAIEIADGMAYLSAKKYVHRDLAARNCMVADDLTVKIGDFGMTRDIYETDYYRKGTKGFLPVRWMAPESLKDGVFSSSSDVFSYGVVLWEMATLASQPYQGLTNDQVLRYVIDGGVMERPENCPDKLYDLMRRCWQHRPTARPSFLDIIQMLLPDAHERFPAVSFFHSPEAHDIAPLQHQIYMDDVTTPLHPDGDDDDDGGMGGGLRAGRGIRVGEVDLEEDDEGLDKDDLEEDEEMRIGDVGTDDEYSMELTNSHLVPNNGPTAAAIRSPHSPLR